MAHWLDRISPVENLLNAITSITAPDQFGAGLEMVKKTLSGEYVLQVHEGAFRWRSAFSGLTVLANKITPLHRDSGGRNGWYDLLFSAGTHSSCYLEVPDLGAHIRYLPGDVVLLAGGILQHAVSDWDGGNRLALAHYMRWNVAERMGVDPGSHPSLEFYSNFMDRKFCLRNPQYRSL